VQKVEVVRGVLACQLDGALDGRACGREIQVV
jgi:hypothetical protein